MEDLPGPGTLDDLIADAADVGWRQANERLLRDWKRMGLLPSPVRRSLGRGQGQAPGVYSPEQRRLFQVLAQGRADAARNDELARAVVYSWLYHSDGWVSSDQALAALRTAVGNPKKSARIASGAARELVNSLDFVQAPRKVRSKLIDEITTQLYRGKIHRQRLHHALSDLLDRGSITVVRGPQGASLSTSRLVDAIVSRAAAVTRFADVTVDEMDTVRQEHRITVAGYSLERPALMSVASPEIQHLFLEPTLMEFTNTAVPTTLYLLDVMHSRARRQGPEDGQD